MPARCDESARSAFLSADGSRGVEMDLPESQVHSFIVKLWLDSVADEADRAAWHGQITHVPDGERRSFTDLDEIRLFIEPYIGDAGSTGGAGKTLRVRRWLKRWS